LQKVREKTACKKRKNNSEGKKEKKKKTPELAVLMFSPIN